MDVKLTEVELKWLVSILKEKYDRSTDLIELSYIKGILQKVGVNVNDWIPDKTDL